MKGHWKEARSLVSTSDNLHDVPSLYSSAFHYELVLLQPVPRVLRCLQLCDALSNTRSVPEPRPLPTAMLGWLQSWVWRGLIPLWCLLAAPITSEIAPQLAFPSAGLLLGHHPSGWGELRVAQQRAPGLQAPAQQSHFHPSRQGGSPAAQGFGSSRESWAGQGVPLGPMGQPKLRLRVKEPGRGRALQDPEPLCPLRLQPRRPWANAGSGRTGFSSTESRQRAGREQAESRQSAGRVQARSRQSTGREQAKHREQAKCRQR